MKKRIINFLYNIDRAFASLIYGTSQETISSMVGRRKTTDPVARVIADGLDDIQKNHTEEAIKHATALDQVDDGKEK